MEAYNTLTTTVVLGHVFDKAVASALAMMLGDIGIDAAPNSNALMPRFPNQVEQGTVRIVGGVRPQNFDVGYRPDGVRFAYDTKTLNNNKSVGKNWQNMINDLATEATTVHTRFPYAVVAFLVAIPTECLVTSPRTQASIVGTLERLARRIEINDPPHLAEAIALVLWDTATGKLNENVPGPSSRLRVEQFSAQVQSAYFARYQGLPPHTE